MIRPQLDANRCGLRIGESLTSIEGQPDRRALAVGSGAGDAVMIDSYVVNNHQFGLAHLGCAWAELRLGRIRSPVAGK